jgi:AraC family transcriptional regulator
VIEYMNTHLQEGLSLVELAEVAGLSFHHFGQAFKMATGRSPHRYVIEKRVERARALLRDPLLSIAEIATGVGFASQSHLTVNFRRLTGLTPARFRRLGA